MEWKVGTYMTVWCEVWIRYDVCRNIRSSIFLSRPCCCAAFGTVSFVTVTVNKQGVLCVLYVFHHFYRSFNVLAKAFLWQIEDITCLNRNINIISCSPWLHCVPIAQINPVCVCVFASSSDKRGVSRSHHVWYFQRGFGKTLIVHSQNQTQWN